jgi:hypothetical protein
MKLQARFNCINEPIVKIPRNHARAHTRTRRIFQRLPHIGEVEGNQLTSSTNKLGFCYVSLGAW